MVQGSQGNPPNNGGKGTPWWANPGAAPPGAQQAQPAPQPQPPVAAPMAQPPPPQPPPTSMPQPQAEPPTAPAGNEAFGFGPQNKDEKYNTEYISTAMVNERRKSQYLILAVIAAVLGTVLWLLLAPKEHKAPEAQAPTKQEAAATPKAEPKAAPADAKATTTPAPQAPAPTADKPATPPTK